MWILNILPEAAIHWTLSISIIGILISFVIGIFPVIKTYKLPIQIISVILLSYTLYLEGSLAKKKEYELALKNMEIKIAKAEAEAANKNVEIQEKIVEKTKVVREKGKKQIEYITKIEKGDTLTIVKDMSEEERKKFQSQIEELRKFNESCTIPSIIIEQHNAAAQKTDNTKK
jgi:hypothetical protein